MGVDRRVWLYLERTSDTLKLETNTTALLSLQHIYILLCCTYFVLHEERYGRKSGVGTPAIFIIIARRFLEGNLKFEILMPSTLVGTVVVVVVRTGRYRYVLASWNLLRSRTYTTIKTELQRNNHMKA